MAPDLALDTAKPMPDFFILGAPKTGTTALAKYLADHPDVYFSPAKEPMFFNTDHGFSEFSDPQKYQAQFAGATSRHKAVGEGSVWYLYSDVAVERIEQSLRAPRYIVCLRNPVELAPSLHSQHLYTGYETLTDFGAAWRAQQDRRAGRRKPVFCPSSKLLLYYEACCLGAQVTRLLDQVPRTRVHFVFHDDLSRDPRGTWQKLQNFLDVPDDGRTDFARVNTRKRLKSQRLGAALRYISHMKRAIRLPGAGLSLMRRIREMNMVHESNAGVSDQMIAHLRSVFTDDIRLLQTICGRDLSDWMPASPAIET